MPSPHRRAVRHRPDGWLRRCVAQGEEVEITKHGTPVATITRPKKSRKRKIPPPGWGLKEGWEIKIADDFDAIPEGFEDYV